MDKIILFLPFLVMFLFLAIISVIVLLILKKNNILLNGNIADKNYLRSQLKSPNTGYLLLFFLGFHYVYMGKLVLQIFYWLTLGGFGIWFVIDLVTLANRISNHNYSIFKLIDELEKKERDL